MIPDSDVPVKNAHKGLCYARALVKGTIGNAQKGLCCAKVLVKGTIGNAHKGPWYVRVNGPWTIGDAGMLVSDLLHGLAVDRMPV